MVIHNGLGQLVCCGQPMIRQVEKAADQGKEKHVPVVTPGTDGPVVKVGEIPHPMEENHYIEWIEITSREGLQAKGLQPGDKPQAVFTLGGTSIKARAYCSVHGLWTNTAKK